MPNPRHPNQVEQYDRQLRPRKRARDEVEAEYRDRHLRYPKRTRNQVERSTEPPRLRTPPSRSNASRKPTTKKPTNKKPTALRRELEELKAKLESFKRKAALVEQSNSRLHRSQGGFPFMDLPLELRQMIWHFAAESRLSAVFEIIQPSVRFCELPPVYHINGTPFRIRFPPSRRLISQACSEARTTLQRQPLRGFPNPIWAHLDPRRDHLLIPPGIHIPQAMGWCGMLGPARNIIVTPRHFINLFTGLRSNFEGVETTFKSILLDIMGSGGVVDSMSLTMDQFRVSAPFQEDLETEFQSSFPIVINVDDSGEIDRADKIFRKCYGGLDFCSIMRLVRDRQTFRTGEPWEDLKARTRRHVLGASGWEEGQIHDVMTKGQTSTGDPRCLELYNRIPTLKRVVMLYRYWEGPDNAQVIGPRCNELGDGRWGK